MMPLMRIIGRNGHESRSRLYSLSDLEKAMDVSISGQPSTTGVTVSETTALYSIPVFACVRVLAETVGSLP